MLAPRLFLQVMEYEINESSRSKEVAFYSFGYRPIGDCGSGILRTANRPSGANSSTVTGQRR